MSPSYSSAERGLPVHSSSLHDFRLQATREESKMVPGLSLEP